MTTRTRKASALSRNLVFLILGLASIILVAVVAVTAIIYRSSAFEIRVPYGKEFISFKFDRNVNLSEVLDKLLSANPEQSIDLKTQKNLVAAVLEQHDFYAIPSKGAADKIRRISSGDQLGEAGTFVSAIRNMLYDLRGPFSQPTTFVGATDDRLLDAFHDLFIHDGGKGKNSPLLINLWQRILLHQDDFLNYRSISNVSVRLDVGLAPGVAKTCLGSILMKLTTWIATNETGRPGKQPVGVVTDSGTVCPPPYDAATSASDLLNGKGTIIWISSDDMKTLTGDATRSRIDNAIVTPLPIGLTTLTVASKPQ